jgi:hypothetical protein
VTSGYAIAAQTYLDNGWWPLPLPSGRKSPPPHGYTGRGGKAPTPQDVARWCETNDGANIGLHLDSTIVGIDVDDYGDKAGGATLATLVAAHGELPATWSSTSRGLGPSRIYYFRIPDGVTFPGVFGEGIDVIQRHHRYAVVSPSTHPDTGEKYRWFDRNNIIATQPPHVDELAPLPQAWIDGLCTKEYVAPPLSLRAPVLVEGDSIAERINQDNDWHTTLIADGWSLSKPGTQQSEWTRPGKNPAKGPSAVLHEPDGPFNVFTTAIAALQQKDADRNGTCWSYSMFGYLAATRHGGDRSALAREYRNDLNATDVQIRTMSSAGIARAVLDDDVEPVDRDGELLGMLVDWPTFWQRDPEEVQWLCEPLIATGRSHVIYAPGGTGKSLLSLWMSAQLATGGIGLEGQRLTPARVLYIDYEMTEADLAERLDAMGHGPESDLSNLKYALLPSLLPADTAAGGEQIATLARLCDAQLVVLDTYSRAVSGVENDADTTRAFYRHTGMLLKAAGRAFIRIDHSGKDTTRGARGSSAKNDDVDVVWQMVKADEGFTITATKKRMSWVPEDVKVIQSDDPVLKYTKTMEMVPAGTAAVIKTLDDLKISPLMSARSALKLLREAGKGARENVVGAAQKTRLHRPLQTLKQAQNGRDALGMHPPDALRDALGCTPEKQAPTSADGWDAPRDARDRTGDAFPLSIGDAPPTHPEIDDQGLF